MEPPDPVEPEVPLQVPLAEPRDPDSLSDDVLRGGDVELRRDCDVVAVVCLIGVPELQVDFVAPEPDTIDDSVPDGPEALQPSVEPDDDHMFSRVGPYMLADKVDREPHFVSELQPR